MSNQIGPTVKHVFIAMHVLTGIVILDNKQQIGVSEHFFRTLQLKMTITEGL